MRQEDDEACSHRRASKTGRGLYLERRHRFQADGVRSQILSDCHARKGGHPENLWTLFCWIPAFAGMTTVTCTNQGESDLLANGQAALNPVEVDLAEIRVELHLPGGNRNRRVHLDVADGHRHPRARFGAVQNDRARQHDSSRWLKVTHRRAGDQY